MDWKFFWVIFSSIFLAELGDKTQLSVLSFSASGRSLWLVFAAASLGLIASTLLGVLAGQWIGKLVPPRAIKITSGLLFILIGVWVIWNKD